MGKSDTLISLQTKRCSSLNVSLGNDIFLPFLGLLAFKNAWYLLNSTRKIEWIQNSLCFPWLRIWYLWAFSSILSIHKQNKFCKYVSPIFLIWRRLKDPNHTKLLRERIFGGEWIHEYIWPNAFAVQLKLWQHC